MHEFLQYRVRDAMTPKPVTTTPDTPLREVENIFEAHDFNGLPVVDKAGHLVGLVTKFDLLKAFMLTSENIQPHYNSIMEHPVESVMRRDPVTVTPDLPVTRLLQHLVEMGVKSFPVVQVVDNDRLVGIVSREDVLKTLRRATEDSPPIQEA
jgi:CBS domain-containing protein